MEKDKIKFNGFEIYKHWHSTFPFEHLCLGLNNSWFFSPEHRIGALAEKVDLKDFRVLELGCLEGAHSFMFQALGAKEVVTIEGRRDNFLKGLIVKNAFNLDKCKFLFGDVNEILPFLNDHFDVCVASGILYHLLDPVSVIHRLGELTNNLFVWTHYATADQPPRLRLSELNHKGHCYRGKYVGEDTRHFLSGLQRQSFWMLEDDLLAAVKHAGFGEIDVIEKEDHEHGPAITFLARK